MYKNFLDQIFPHFTCYLEFQIEGKQMFIELGPEKECIK